MRIGERLVRAGLISRQQLQEALANQVIQGARLGTNLIERGWIGLDRFAAELAAQMDVPAALRDDFEAADPSLRERLAAEMAAELRAVPLRRQDNWRILVAVCDPLDTDVAAELSEAFGSEVELAVAPELRVLYYLERFYDIPRPNRLLRIRVDTLHALESAGAEAGADDEPPAADPARERRRFVTTLSDALPDPAPVKLARVAVRRRAAPAGDALVELNTLEDRIRAIETAAARDRVGDLLVSALRRDFEDRLDAGVILVIRDEVAIGWKGFVRGGREDAVEAAAVPLTRPSFLLPCYRDATTYVGSPAELATEIDRRLWSLLGTETPAEVTVVPVAPENHVVCLLYAHAMAADRLDAGCLRGIRALAQAATTAFERLIHAARR